MDIDDIAEKARVVLGADFSVRTFGGVYVDCMNNGPALRVFLRLRQIHVFRESSMEDAKKLAGLLDGRNGHYVLERRFRASY
jgi:hypothetical protein